jgi:hypothetical protein
MRNSMGKVVALSKMKRLCGSWKSCDGFSDIEFTIEMKGNTLTVSGTDREDGEVAEIHGLVWDETTLVLSFSAYWRSSGRFTKYRFMPSPVRGRAEVTFTYTAQELWEKA